MASNPEIWETKALGEVFEFNPKRELKRAAVAPFLAMGDIVEHERLPVLKGTRDHTSGARFAVGDVLFARITPSLENGKTAFVKSLAGAKVGRGSTEFIVLSGRPGVSDGLFAYYLCRHAELRDYAVRQMSGSSGRQRVAWGALAAYRRPLPELAEQQRIARLLGAIDDKIENNRRRGSLAEELAEAVFTDIYVAQQGIERTLATEIGNIPPGWITVPFTDVVEVNPSVALTRGVLAPFVEMADVRPWATRPFRIQHRPAVAGCRFASGDTLFARIAGCVEHGKGAFLDFVDGAGTGSTEFVVLRAKALVTPEVAFLLSRHEPVRRHVMAQMSGSSGRQRVPAAAFGTVRLAVPASRADWQQQADVIAAGFCLSRALWLEAFKLAALRDTLLAPLLDGRLRVPETDAVGDLADELADGVVTP